MATRTKSKTKPKSRVAAEPMMTPVMPEQDLPKSAAKRSDRWMSLGWSLLLLGGLAHMLPGQMEPLLKWSFYGISVQMVVGVLSVVIALYYLLGEE
ncbi:MAG: hypothetical protein UX87_C0009G0034 [Candidatus Amesbacteria bacterium GW2011_GWA1_47_16]|uniref:Uncharacterized protein n=4 Tax=Candidatus Amesiibacteriota TaxID=1752730 RepID=A0A1F4ZVF5_9BACT|nr:MAG: hypothetical protein UX86_C0011G0018 [Candidatus Amesbacteria bacterium GW2011_GWC1_47_15]KKU64352.1 MAG: hypothetical protein UX87_C0009G0034 [Candidatus Amesbacteria bacterium GW2011_GWA1_47_16]KKU98424.1 MAG: hypothetical protein UY28_C0002G0029 [Candidatus Amesbacteria bacterium GW2011_GWB1_48_13]OGD10409.1 MAG: hypothetical protein A2395_04820 [Candidatus Amesbacteria bacterium RIFOXYB1_FULL_47_9]